MRRLIEQMNPPDLLRVWVRLYHDRRGQDMIEYALMAAFIAVASAAVLPEATPSISTVLSKVGSVLTVAGAN
jgi:pilus assembly protein Flp/PilA